MEVGGGVLHNTTLVMVLSYDSEFISSALLWDMVGFKTLRHRFTERKTDPRESTERKKERKKVKKKKKMGILKRKRIIEIGERN